MCLESHIKHATMTNVVQEYFVYARYCLAHFEVMSVGTKKVGTLGQLFATLSADILQVLIFAFRDGWDKKKNVMRR